MVLYITWIFCKVKEGVYRRKSVAKYFDLEPNLYLKQMRVTNDIITRNNAVVILIKHKTFD